MTGPGMDEERADIVRRIFREASDGDGTYTITRSLNQSGIKPFGRSSFWIQSYVTKILNGRAVLGEYQPHRLIDGQRVPEGDPIPDYFPRVIPDDVFYDVQSARKQRAMGGSGRRGPTDTNLFKNIAVCFYCGSPMHCVNKGNGSKGAKYLRCSGAHAGSGCCAISWRYEAFEASFLFFCKEIDVRAIARGAEMKEERARFNTRKSQLLSEIDSLQLQMERTFEMSSQTSTSTGFVAAKLDELQNQINERMRELDEASRLQNTVEPATDISAEELSQFSLLIGDTESSKSKKTRALLRNRIVRIVEYLRIAPDGGRHSFNFTPPVSISAPAEPRMEIDTFKKLQLLLIEAKEPHPFFQVGFTGDVHRVVSVDPSSPTKHTTLFERDGPETWLSYGSGTKRKVLDDPERMKDISQP